MKLSKSFLLLLLIAVGCNNETGNTKNYEKVPASLWEKYLDKINSEEDNRGNSVYLFLTSTECPPCLQELKWWNKNAKEVEGVDVKLVLIERHTSTFNAFVKTKNINLPTYQDRNGLAVKNDLIPVTPYKVFLAGSSEVKALEPIGSNGKLSSFLDKVKKLTD